MTRRTMVGLTALGAPALVSPARAARAFESTGNRFSVETAGSDVHAFDHVHKGLGSLGVRLFSFGGAPHPANFLIYDIAPGSSEGVHVHNVIDPALGAFDEYYYIIEGSGVMAIDGKPVSVAPGDHVHTPMGVHHGIENDGTTMLRVFLTYINRATGAVGSLDTPPA